MTSIDLAGVKTKLTSSLASFNSLTSEFGKLSAGVSNFIPELTKLGDALPDLTGSLNRAIGGLGTSITSASTLALPKMQSMVENLIPNTSKIQDLCKSTLNKLGSGLFPSPPGLQQNITKIADESKKIENTSKEVSNQYKAENQQADNSYQTLITEIDTIASTLGNYSNTLGVYLFNQSGSMPHFSQAVGSIKMEQLQTTADEIKLSSVDLSTGTVSANLYKAAGVVREATIRSFNKAYLYQNAELELGRYNEEVTSEAGKDVNRTRNTTPEQDTGI